MRIVLKPGGLALLFLGIVILAGVAITNKHGNNAVAIPIVSATGKPSSSPRTAFHLVEAESSGGSETRTDTTASGGKYIHVIGYYHPFVEIDCPTGEVFTVWARVRQTAVQLKGTPGGTQKEYAWNFDAPKHFRWVRLGRHTRAELGSRVLFIRATGDNETGNDGLDAVLFAPDDTLNPETDL